VGNGGTLTLARTLVAGNTAPAIVNNEISNHGTIAVDNHNLFGVDGSAGVEGFSPGSTDVVPDAGVLLSDILDSNLADHGGSTLTHALVPGSPAINVGPSTCPVPGGGVLQQDQRGVQRPQEGACDIGAYEFLPVVECRGHLATLVGSAQADVLVGTSGNDVIRALEGDDIVDGKGGNDIICGGRGNDILRGGPGQDELFGGQGNDTLEGGAGKDLCDGDEGQDTHAGGCEKLRDIP
jgi:Ca2+-binding RTX toxin-like protein